MLTSTHALVLASVLALTAGPVSAAASQPTSPTGVVWSASAAVEAPLVTQPSRGQSAVPSAGTGAVPSSTPVATLPAQAVGESLRQGDSGPAVRALQQRLSELGYWSGGADGRFGPLTTQAVLALQKAAGISRDGVVGPVTEAALKAGTRPQARAGGDGIEIDLARQLLLVVRDGRVVTALNTSTGVPGRHDTPRGQFRVERAIDGLRVAPLGELWRPRYFHRGYAVHGSPSIPAHPASHGCARLSDAAMDMIWAEDLMPIGSSVLVY